MRARDNVADAIDGQLQLPGEAEVGAATVMVRMLADGTRLRLASLIVAGDYT